MTEKDRATGDDGSGLDPRDQRAAVRERYGSIATDPESCCGDAGSDCGDAAEGSTPRGYADRDFETVDPDSVLGLGCGNPSGIASLEAGDTVLDLGSGGGFDCLLAAEEVGSDGQVIGVDMTPEMVERARETADERGTTNVEFRLGEIEHLPVADASVDVILSNCVVNLSPDKPRVFREAYRVLRPGGRLAIADVVATADLPAEVRDDPTSVAACVSGASSIPELEAMLADAGFEDVSIAPDDDSEAEIRDWDPERDLSDYLVAATIEATKPPSEGQ